MTLLPATQRKIEEIQKLVDEGKTLKEIRILKFNNSPKKYDEWYEKFGNLVSWDNLVAEPVQTTLQVVDETIPEKELPSSEMIPFNFSELEKLKRILASADDLLSLLEPTDVEMAEEIHILDVPQEFLKMGDLEYKSLRVSKKVEKMLDELAQDNKQFTKTALVNFALYEFCQKYKKS